VEFGLNLRVYLTRSSQVIVQATSSSLGNSIHRTMAAPPHPITGRHYSFSLVGAKP
jgi:hypothetical protein